MTLARPLGFLRSGALGLIAALAPVSLPAEDRSLVAVDGEGRALVVIAREAVAAASGDLLGDAADEWIAAPVGGGLAVRSGDDGSLLTLADIAPRALAVADRTLVVALEGGGILRMDLERGESWFIAGWTGSVLAAGDLDADGDDEIVAALEDGRLMLLDADGEKTSALAAGRGLALAAGDFLERGHDQLAVLREGGAIEVLDLAKGDATPCFVGVGPSPESPASGGLSAHPSGLLLVSDPGGPLAALDPMSCEILDIDLAELEVTHEPVFTSYRETVPPPRPPCPITSIRCVPALQGEGREVEWEAPDVDCVCELVEVRSATGEVLATPPAGANRVVIPCERLGDGTELVVACIGATGAETSARCDFEPCDADGGGLQRPGDCNQDGSLDISDVVCLLGHLFLGNPSRLPCGDGSSRHPANTTLLDANGDNGTDISDPVFVLTFLFVGGREPVLGKDCVAIEGCPERCR